MSKRTTDASNPGDSTGLKGAGTTGSQKLGKVTKNGDGTNGRDSVKT